MGVWGPALSAVLGAILVAVQTALDPFGVSGEAVTIDELVFIINGFLNAVLIAIVPNLVGGVNRVTKAIVHGLLMVTSAIVGLYVDGLSPVEWINLLILFLSGAGVIGTRQPAFPNTPTIIKPLETTATRPAS
jgi:hypothetical protein